MTAVMGAAARSVAAADTEIILATSKSGAPSIEGRYDEALSVMGLIELVRDAPVADAYVIACFGDPGLKAAREIVAGPVLGIAEAATFVANSFSVVTTLSRCEQSQGISCSRMECKTAAVASAPLTFRSLSWEKLEAATQAKLLHECERRFTKMARRRWVLGVRWDDVSLPTFGRPASCTGDRGGLP